MDSVAITDNGNMYAAIEFYKAANKEGIKPIIGMDAYVAPNGMHERRGRVDAKPYRLTLLVENMEGYKNLMELSSQGFLEGFYYKPRIDKELLAKHTKGLIALSGGLKGEIPSVFHDSGEGPCKEVIKEYVEMFGKDNFFIELVDHPEAPEQVAMNEQLIKIAKEMDVPVVATKNIFYLDKEDREAWKILNCVRDGKTIEDFDRYQQVEYDLSFVSPDYMEEQFKHLPEAIENTRKIADRCNLELELDTWNFPPVDLPDGYDADTYLKKLVYERVADKVPEVNDEVKERIEYELDIIKIKGFSSYFLSVSDYTKWARDNKVVTTTRGSAAGSLVSYIMGISSLNPLVYKLPFERFLNPERPSAPDVDADFADNQRDKVLGYVTEKYGVDSVAQICTFGKMLARGSVRDAGRGLGLPYSFCDTVAKLIPMGSQGFPMTISIALEQVEELRKMQNEDPQARRLLDLSQKIEGCARHVSVHAAGVVIAPQKLIDYTPLQRDNKEGKIITQYEMHSVESAGLIKMDFLGIRNLSILGDSIKLVKAVKGDDIDINNIPLDDPKTFKLLAKGNTMGVFQLSGDGMTRYLVELKPTRIQDIMAMVALYRPGPMESIPEYIRRKFNPKLVSYLDPRMEDILDQSFGIVTYQDDVMLIAIKMAGFSWLEADKLRKAMGKKIPELMAEQKKKLLKGLAAHGLEKKKIQQLWKLIEPFAAYGFNKAHACSYGMVAYQTAYMKANYPAEYMAALMTAESANADKIADAVSECERMGISVLPPDVNESLSNFTYIDDKTIRFGLLAIKNLGEEIIDTIINERKDNGQFVDLANFAKRIKSRNFNKKSLDALIKTGATDRFGERNQLLQNMERILLFNKHIQREIESNQGSLFDLTPDLAKHSLSLRESDPATKKEKLAWEKELLGLYVSDHPYSDYEKSIGKYLTPCNKLDEISDGKFVKIGGVIADVRQIFTKKNDPMAFVKMEDTTGHVDLVVFPKTFKEFQEIIKEDQLISISGKVSKKDGETNIICNSIVVLSDETLEEITSMLASGMWVADNWSQSSSPANGQGFEDRSLSIKLSDKPDQEIVELLRDIFTRNPGMCQVYLVVSSAGGEQRVETDFRVENSSEVIEQIESIVGEGNVVF